MLINGLNRTRILKALVLVLLMNSFLYCPRAAHLFSKETRSVKALLLGQSKTSYYKVLLYEHSIYSYVQSPCNQFSQSIMNVVWVSCCDFAPREMVWFILGGRRAPTDIGSSQHKCYRGVYVLHVVALEGTIVYLICQHFISGFQGE
jgi:hypothetical protein